MNDLFSSRWHTQISVFSVKKKHSAPASSFQRTCFLRNFIIAWRRTFLRKKNENFQIKRPFRNRCSVTPHSCTSTLHMGKIICTTTNHYFTQCMLLRCCCLVYSELCCTFIIIIKLQGRSYKKVLLKKQLIFIKYCPQKNMIIICVQQTRVLFELLRNTT